ncbi:T9SS type A sorting domain-containing protein [Adhaeribacter soli]|uniref:T9SS type A sorting domain-containing protein n=1 Tax=Adhaeribacter soli TaxID=2607655 RepID=A0A5N1J4V6_9BACT|nr:T9SS type A sorting domain-containing protein [Adhaeribacter soli]KAA9345757.1 T9SS type A sorting domain-containing protein [Adhaeribacter soli]
MRITLYNSLLLSGLTFISVSFRTNAQSIAAGSGHTIYVCNNKVPVATGNNGSGQFGVGPTPNTTSTPITVSGISNVIAAAASDDFTLYLKGDGTVWGTGRNLDGQLGDGTTTNRKTLAQVSTLTGVVAISAGLSHSLFLKNDGTVWACGDNGNGALGDGTTTDKTTPFQIPSLSGITAIAAGGLHSLFLKNDGTVWACGSNIYGELGDGTTVKRRTPVQVTSLSGITAISASPGSVGILTHSLFLKSNGTVWGCGTNSNGQLGDGSTTQRNTPVQVSGLTGIIKINAGRQHSLFLKNNGNAWAVGNNASGQLGDGTTVQKTTAVQVPGLTNVVAIESGWDHSLFLKADGTISACGFNGSGQLGNGTTANASSPILLTNLCSIALSVKNDSESLPVSIYPNPARGQITIDFPTYRNAKAKLYNVQGKLVQEIALDQPKTTLSTSGLNKGIYLLKLNSTSGQVFTKKIVLE